MANLMETMELVDVKHRVRITANAHSVIYMNNKFISNYENTNSIDLLSYIQNYTHEGRKTQCPLLMPHEFIISLKASLLHKNLCMN